MTALHIFDMDGTLLAGSSACLEVARHTGTLAEVTALERGFAVEGLSTWDFATAICQLWHDLTPDQVSAAFAAGPWLAGMADVCADIRRRGERSAVVTMSPDFFADLLLGAGFDEVVASRFPALPFAAPPERAGILRPQDKVVIAERLRERHGLRPSRCVAYGDSLSDAPLFAALRHTVAVNADHQLAGLAALAYRGSDLREAYRLARTLLDRDAERPGGPAAPPGTGDRGY